MAPSTIRDNSRYLTSPSQTPLTHYTPHRNPLRDFNDTLSCPPKNLKYNPGTLADTSNTSSSDLLVLHAQMHFLTLTHEYLC